MRAVREYGLRGRAVQVTMMVATRAQTSFGHQPMKVLYRRDWRSCGTPSRLKPASHACCERSAGLHRQVLSLQQKGMCSPSTASCVK